MVGTQESEVIGRSVELRAISDFLLSAERRPTGLIVEGEAGIGRTTVWLRGLDLAQERGFRVLSTRIGPTDSVLDFAALADILGGVEPEVIAQLPEVQRLAVDRVLLRAIDDGPATDQRTVAAALAAALNKMAIVTPLIVAADNVQWLDPSSRSVLAFAVRRLAGPIGVLVTERCEPDCGDTVTWLHLPTPGALERVRVGHLSLGGLHEMISARLGRSFSRPTMVRIAEISGGNPFYALELARAIHTGSSRAQPTLPSTLTDLMRMRIGDLDGPSGDALLAAASVPHPTIELLTKVLGDRPERTVELLEEAENKGVVAIDGNSVRFSHPLLAQSVYTVAKPARRRKIHRLLADALVVPELKARHMALATSSADPDTLQALDHAADAARRRGAPAAAAELLELAMNLGGDTPPRRIRAADHHFKAGDADRVRDLLDSTIPSLRPGPLRGIALNLRAGLRLYEDAYSEAVRLLTSAMEDAENQPGLKVQTLMSLALAQGVAGSFDESLQSAREAERQAEQLAFPPLLSQALAMRVYTEFHHGHGADEDALRRALEAEDPSIEVPVPFSATAVNALVNAWTGQLSVARRQMAAVRDRYLQRGAENDLVGVIGYCALIEIWRGNFADAAQLADDIVERAEQVGGSRAIALTVRAAVAAYAGREQDARADAAAVLEIAKRCRSPRLAEWPSMSLGLLEVSLGRFPEALTAVQPMMENFSSHPATEIMTASFVPDAVEALISLGRYDDAEPFVEKLERNGERLSRGWMLAVGARCRSMLLAARGDSVGAASSMRDALAEHEKLQMPFECARTQLLAGQLERRQRQKEKAITTLNEALLTFEKIGATLWAARARAELARVNVTPTRDIALTPSEQRVADLAAEGKTNRDIAAAMFISPKTVEAHLARIYRKLGIRSRAELGRIIGIGN